MDWHFQRGQFAPLDAAAPSNYTCTQVVQAGLDPAPWQDRSLGLALQLTSLDPLACPEIWGRGGPENAVRRYRRKVGSMTQWAG